MDENTPTAHSPAPSPARGRGGTNRRGHPGKNFLRKTAHKAIAKRGGGRGRRGRNKTYDDPRVQGVYERVKELKDIYTEVASAMKPALEKLADHTLNHMIETPTAHQQVPEYVVLQNELDDRLDHAIHRADFEQESRDIMEDNQSELAKIASNTRFQDGFEYTTDEFLDGILNRIAILEELRREDVGTVIPATNFTYVQAPDEVVNNQVTYVVYRDGVEVPYPSLLEDHKTSAVRGTLHRKPKPGPKRKAEDLPDGQPESKKHTGPLTGTAGDTSIPRPRHIGGLLSAENEQDGDPESNAPSPTPVEEGLSPESEQKGETTSSKKDLPDLPGGASEPDQWGVSTVYRRGPKANNRLIIPSLFDFDDDEIGFRDSTNDPTRKATRNTRGKYLNTPNSRYWHLDATIAYCNCLDNEDGTLDPDLVKKHNVHPKYGFFLPDSTNESEASSEHVDGTRPVVVITPNGSTLHASRSVRAKGMDDALKNDRRKGRLSSMLSGFTQNSNVTTDDITTEQMRRRQAEAQDRLVSEPDVEDDTLLEESHDEQVIATSPVDESVRLAGASQLLHAALHVEEADRLQLPTSTQRASRPYDAVRDVFGDSEPSVFQPVNHVDTYGLSVLADVAEDPEAYYSPSETSYADSPSSMIDPRLLNGSRQAPTNASNGFLQTALNPSPAFTAIAPAPLQNMDGQLQTQSSRVPFTNQSNTKGSPALPPLRPSRREKAAAAAAAAAAAMEGPPSHPPPFAGSTAAPLQPQPPAPPPRDFGSPRGLLQTNTGSFYPPASHRPFHHSFSVQEPAPMMSMPLLQGPPMNAPPMMHNGPPPPPQHVVPYPAMSPPMPGQAQLAPMPPQMGPSPPLPPQGPYGLPGTPMMGSSPPSSSRQRGSISSNSQNAGKYRKIAAAPIPHNRPWASNGGSELRLSNYDPKGAIKDYTANEPPPRTAPISIRGWSVSNGQKRGSRAAKKEGSVEDLESPK
ncbi:hypothetical protein BJ170DRAFT_693380 [Xylariales sp. AK1849]|nr:hypothetical protein BJ170DRAFT_693380 [Xylariales sp. AK1849]